VSRQEVLRQRLDQLLDALADLRRYAATVDRIQLSTQRDVQHMVLHAIYVAVQASIDLALHVLADREAAGAPTYPDAFRQLAQEGLLDTKLAERMVGWAGLRNIVAHQYTSIDYGRIHDILTQELGELEAYARAAAGWTEGKP
jgi:uncharacterized protein YutE (UPF0331/DUF86 family)